MRKIRWILFIILILAIFFLNYNISSMKVEHGAFDDEFNLIFSMSDIEAFNSFKSSKDLSIKAELAYGEDTYDVKLKNISKDNKLAFTLNTNKNFRIYDRQAYEVITIDNNDVSSYKTIYDFLRKQGIYTPEFYRVKLFINNIDYGAFFMKQCYDENFIEESNLKGALIFSVKQSNDKLTSHIIYSSLDNSNEKELEILQIENFKGLIDYSDSSYINKLEEFAGHIGVEKYFFVSDNTVFLYREDNNKIYPIIDPLLLHEDNLKQINRFCKEEQRLPEENENINQWEEANILESFNIGSIEAKIDHDNRVVFSSLEKGADTLQKITYKLSKHPKDLFIDLRQNDEEFEWTKLENGKEYDFKQFIYKGKLSYTDSGNRVIYDLYITTGDVQIIEISTENEMGELVDIDISDKIPCDIRVLSNKDEEYANKIIKGEIEISGKTLNEKKSYSIRMDKKYELDGMSAAKDWILDGSVLDISLMRKKLTYDVLKQIYESDDIKMSIPEVRYAEVILNGQYQGLYTLSHKIDEDLLNLDNFKSFKTDNDLLYKCVNVNGKFISENLDRSIYGKDYKDFPYGLQPESKDLDPLYGWHSGYEQKWPDTKEYGQYWEPLEKLIRTIALSSDEEFINIFSTVDREKLINLWILLLTQNNLNGIDNGQYIIKEGKWFFIPWETNQTFGIDEEMNKVRYDLISLDYLLDRCMKIDSFNKDFVDKWEAFVDRGIIAVENLHNLIERYFREIEDSQKRNYERWSISGEVNFNDEVEYMKSWIKSRINWLDLHLHGEETYEE